MLVLDGLMKQVADWCNNKKAGKTIVTLDVIPKGKSIENRMIPLVLIRC